MRGAQPNNYYNPEDDRPINPVKAGMSFDDMPIKANNSINNFNEHPGSGAGAATKKRPATSSGAINTSSVAAANKKSKKGKAAQNSDNDNDDQEYNSGPPTYYEDPFDELPITGK